MIGDRLNPNFDCLLDGGPLKTGKSVFSIIFRPTRGTFGKTDVMTDYYVGFFAMLGADFDEEC